MWSNLGMMTFAYTYAPAGARNPESGECRFGTGSSRNGRDSIQPHCSLAGQEHTGRIVADCCNYVSGGPVNAARSTATEDRISPDLMTPNVSRLVAANASMLTCH